MTWVFICLMMAAFVSPATPVWAQQAVPPIPTTAAGVPVVSSGRALGGAVQAATPPQPGGVAVAGSPSVAPVLDPSDPDVRALFDIDRALGQAGGGYPRLVRDALPAGRIQDVWAASRPGQSIRTERYDPTREIKLRVREGAHTVVALPEWERVASGAVFVGQKDALKVVVDQSGAGNRVIVQGKAGYDDTVTVMGSSGLIYPFYVVVENDRSRNVPDFVVYVDARQPLGWEPPDQDKSRRDGRPRDYLRELPFDVTKARADFEMSGDSEIAPYFVVSDDVVTQLYYRDLDRVDVPSVNRVVDDIDRPVNVRRAGNILLVEAPVGQGLTLRHGQRVVCVRVTRGAPS